MQTNRQRFVAIGFACLAWALFCQTILQSVVAANGESETDESQPWRLHSYAEDAQLTGRNVFHLDFQKDKHSGRLEKVWVATSGGLLEYDGYDWRRHGVSQGLPSDFIRCVLVTRQGDLWVGTDRGAGIYDGNRFHLWANETNLAGVSVRRMVEDKDGSIWFCSDPWPSSSGGGGLTHFRDGQWRRFTTKEGLPSEYVVNYLRDSSDRQWVVTKDGVARWTGSAWEPALVPRPGKDKFSSGCFADVPGHPLLFSSGVEMFQLERDVWNPLIPVTNPIFHQHGVCTTQDGKILSAVSSSSDRKTISEWRKDRWVGLSGGFDLPRGYSEDIREDPQGNIWVVGFETVVCWRRNAQWNLYRNVPPPKFVEPSNRVWFGWDSGGVRPSLVPMRFESGKWERLGVAYNDVFPAENGGAWGWFSNKVTHWSGTNATVYTAAETGIQAIQAGKNGSGGAYWLLGLDAQQQRAASRFLDGRWTVYPLPHAQGSFLKSGLAAFRDSLWLVLQSSATSNAMVLKVATPAITSMTVPSNILSEFHHGLHVRSDGSEVWIYGDAGLYRTRPGSGQWESIQDLPGRMVIGMVERNNEIWVGCSGATGGNIGLARYRDGQWTRYPLRSLANISLAPDLTVLVGGKGFLTVIENRPDAVPREIELPHDIRLDGVVKDLSGHYWAGNGESLLRFVPDGMPPETRIQSGITNIVTGGNFALSVKAVERFRPFANRSDHLFSWNVNGQGWTPFQSLGDREIEIKELPIGTHQIEVRAQDAGGDMDPTPAKFSFAVHPLPLQSRPWFQWSVLAIFVLITSLGVVAVRARSQLASYATVLEHKVAERTAELQADLVERRRAEAALRESEERWQFALEGAGDGLWDWKIESDEVHHSGRWKSMLGYGDNEIGDRLEEWSKRLHPEDKSFVLERIQAHLDGKLPYYESEHRILCKDGSYKWILDRGKVMVRTPEGRPLRLIGTQSDITSRKESERMVREAQLRFQQLADNIREVFLLTNLDRTQILYVSPGYERIWGRSCDSLYDAPKSWLERVHAEDRERVAERLSRPLMDGVCEIEYRIVRPDGSIRWIHDRAFPVPDLAGRVYRVAGIVEDVTERRQLEAQFRQAQKMEALGTLSGGIAHDFNNILGAIFGNVHLAKLDLNPAHPAAVSLQEIQKAANRARDLVGQILAFSRKQPKSRQVIPLAPVIKEVVGLLRASLPAEIELATRITAQVPSVFADGSQIHQVLLNLCTNAWHAIGPGPGRIEIRLEKVEVDHGQSLSPDLHQGRYACLSVIDNGHGMDASTLERIFEPFFTTKEPGRGTGLGLSVVHGIVQSHDGVIRVTSRPGQGTAFHLYFPAVESETTSIQPMVQSLRRGSGERILYVDDERPLVDLAVKMLHRLDYEVDGFTDVDAALKAFENNPDRYKLIVTDLHMPRVSGIEFVEAVRRIHPTIPVMLSSGHITDQIISRARKHGVSRLLHKPNTMDEFSEALHELLRKNQP